MPLDSPQLDDLRHQLVFEQLRRQIPIYTREWTDHNESDPGIALLQLFSHLAEQIGYRLNRLPDKVYVELLKLIGIRLAPAAAAHTKLAFFLSRPESTVAFTIVAGAKVKARTKAAPTFETTLAVDAVPAQIALLATTQSQDLRDLTSADGTSTVPQRFALAWDGRMPKPKDMPAQPVKLFTGDAASHRTLWLGLAFNPDPTAGFLGQRVTLHVTLDDDERPESLAMTDCDFDLSLDTGGLPVTNPVGYRYYRPGAVAPSSPWRTLRILSDSTEGWTRSGEVQFDVPLTLGPIPNADWVALSGTPSRPHPLVGQVKSPVQGAPSLVPLSGWIAVDLPMVDGAAIVRTLRSLTFNAAPAIHATSVVNELVGRGIGRSDQAFRLARGNVLELELAVQDMVDGALHTWTRVDDFDEAGPDDRVYVLDPEAGQVYFGDGRRGAFPEFGARIVVLRYLHGGGETGELPPAVITQEETLPAQVSEVTNVIAARGGSAAETLDDAKRRAPKVLRSHHRAVTAEDFRYLARHAPGAGIVRAEVVTLRRPYLAEGLVRPGLDLDRIVPGVVSVITIPDLPWSHPTPSEAQLRAVCRHLDRHRLITTEIYVVPPMYVRLFDIVVTVVAKPGFTRAELRERLAAAFMAHFHVLVGEGGKGFAFGATLHHSELVALALRTEGVERVEQLVASYDGRSPHENGDVPALFWRDERRTARRLTACPMAAGEDDQVVLAADEVPFVDGNTLNVIVRS